MLNLKNLFVFLLSMNVLALFVLGFNFYTIKDPVHQASRFEARESSLFSRPNNLYTRLEDEPMPESTGGSEMSRPEFTSKKVGELEFVDPEMAFYILQQLDVYEATPNSKLIAGKIEYGLKPDDEYCEKHRAYLVEHPEIVFEQRNFLTSFGPTTLVRRVINKVGNDVMPQIGDHMAGNARKTPKHDVRPDITMLWTLQGLHTSRTFGKSYGCITQIINQLFGRTDLNRKDKLAESVVRYARLYKDRPQCFNFTKFFPETWVLADKEQCEDFFQELNSEKYQELKEERTIVYIRKIGAGSHQAKGVQTVDDKEELAIRDKYKNGTLCGKVTSSYIIQTYIYNPLLLNGHKFDFRVYMVVASTNPIILYYHDGFLRVSLHPYNVSSDDKSVLLTNTALSNKIFDIARKEGNYQGLNETELRNFQMWNLERLKNHLIEKKIISDENWLDNYLRPEFKKAMVHLIRMASGPFIRRSPLYELFGTDFMLDDKLNLWFIECNSGPVLSGSSEEKERFVTQMLSDQFDIVFGLLKSRTKRIINFVNDIIREGEAQKTPSGEVNIKDLAQKQQQFKELIKNNFEPEFEPGSENGFSKIVDENYEGEEKYAYLLKEECF